MDPDRTQAATVCPRCDAIELFEPTIEGVAAAERWLAEHDCPADEPTTWSSDK